MNGSMIEESDDRSPGGMSRRRLTQAAVAAALLVPAACSSGSTGADDGTVTITYGLWAPEFREAFQAAADAFHEENPDVTVEFVQTPFDDYFTKLNTQLGSDTAPDAFWLQNIQFDLYARNGALADLSPLRDASTTDLSGVPDSVADPYVVDGKLYAVPWQALPFGLYYNQALFEQAGVPVPTNDWTWVDVDAAAARLTDPAAGVYGIAAPVWNYGTYYQTMYQAGADIISDDRRSTDFDSPAAVEGLSVWIDFMRKGYSPTVAQMSDNPADSWFSSGKVAMITSGPWVASSYLEAEVGEDTKVVQMPGGTTDVTGYATTTTAIAASSPHVEQAYAFAEFLESDAGQKILAASGVAGAPVNANAREAYVDAIPGVGIENLLDQIPTARLLPSSAATSVWEDEQPSILEPAWSGETTVEAAADQLAVVTRAALAEEQ